MTILNYNVHYFLPTTYCFAQKYAFFRIFHIFAKGIQPIGQFEFVNFILMI